MTTSRNDDRRIGDTRPLDRAGRLHVAGRRALTSCDRHAVPLSSPRVVEAAATSPFGLVPGSRFVVVGDGERCGELKGAA
jgi:hypothetical protein